MIKKVLCLLSVLLMATACNAPDVDKGTDYVFQNIDEEFVLLKDTVIVDSFSEFFDDYEYPKSVSGKGILYGDRMSDIAIVTNGYDAKVIIDGMSAEIYCESMYGANIVDLDSDDGFFELALYSEGASADPTVDFIRFDGKEIEPITYYNEEWDYESSGIYGYFEADETDVLSTYGAIWTNRDGTIITSFQNVGFTDKRIALSCFKLSGNEWELKDLTDTIDLSQKYVISEDFAAFFTPLQKVPVSFESEQYLHDFDFEKQINFEKGQEIEIIDFGELYDYYGFYVKSGGEKGVVAFWTGD